MQAFLVALQFLTCIPVRMPGPPRPEAVSASLVHYPAVGLVLGLILGAAAWTMPDLPPLLRAALLLAAWVPLTGAMHLDGLADSADAWVGGHGDPGRTLDIMKDPRAGPAGVTAVVLVLMVKLAALAALPGPDLPRALVLATVLGRTAVAVLFLTTRCVRDAGLGAALARHLPRRAVRLAAAVVVFAVLALGGAAGAGALAAAAAVLLLLRRAMQRRLGGTTGDTAGALVELTETAILVTLAVTAAVPA